MIRLICYIVFILCLSANAIQAQEIENRVSDTEFEELSKEISFDKTRNSIKLRNKRKPRKGLPNTNNNLFKGIGSIFNLLAYALIGALVIFIVFMIFSNIKMKNRLPTSVINETGLDEIEDIEKIDLDSMYDEAIAKGDFRLALRIRYLKILQYLSLENFIEWKSDKTNRDYITELRGTHYFESFRKLSNIFEWVWYGNKSINKEIFNSCQQEFDTFKIQKA